MRTHVRVTAAALIVLGGLTTGCVRTTPGTVAMTTEPGRPITTRTPSTTETSIPEVPAPPDALTMTCGDYVDLDDATQLAVVRAILGQGENPLGPLGPQSEEIAKTLADTVCQFLPDSTVNDVLLGGGPP
jgi:hypothetical protein